MQRRRLATTHCPPVQALAVIAAVSLAGCATNPNDIPPQDVSAAKFNTYSCSDLGKTYGALNGAIASMSDDWRPARLTDIYGYIPVVPVVFPHFPMPWASMIGTNREGTISYMKGEQAAVMRMAVAKNCAGAALVPTGDSNFILK